MYRRDMLDAALALDAADPYRNLRDAPQALRDQNRILQERVADLEKRLASFETVVEPPHVYEKTVWVNCFHGEGEPLLTLHYARELADLQAKNYLTDRRACLRLPLTWTDGEGL